MESGFDPLTVQNTRLRHRMRSCPNRAARWRSGWQDMGRSALSPLLPHRPAQLAQSIDVIQRVAGVPHSVEEVSGLAVLHVAESFADLSERDRSAK
jgi:hypothetical protein